MLAVVVSTPANASQASHRLRRKRMPAERFLAKIDPRYALDRRFYAELRNGNPNYKLIDRLIIPPRNGRGFAVSKGQTIRIVTVDGPQVSDVAFWSADDPKEFFDASRTAAVEGWFVKRFSRLWSQVPYFRPIATCIEDTVVQRDTETGFRHHFIGTHCAPEVYELRHGRAGLNACHLMILQGIEPFGLKEENILHNVNVHQKVRIDSETGLLYCAMSDAKPGDYVEFYAEVDILVSCSICPNGPGLNEGLAPETDELHPVGIEIYDTGTQPKDFPGWTDWRKTWNGKWVPANAAGG
jgi:uncharacterized protein YcgI (DUF1989 family)